MMSKCCCFFYLYELYDTLILPYYKELSSKTSKLPNIISEVQNKNKI